MTMTLPVSIILTNLAEQQLQSVIQGSQTATSSQRGIRIAVKHGGCNGYEYGLSIVNTPKPNDILVDYEQVRIYVDAESAPLLNGIVVDFIDGLLDSGFKFTNPNATETCSCGKSFQAGSCTPAGIPCQ